MRALASLGSAGMEVEAFARLRARVFGRPTLVVDSNLPVPLFVHLEISRLNRLALIVVRGHLTVDAARDVLAQLAAANVPSFAKIIDISGMAFDSEERLKRLAAVLRRASRTSLGRVGLVVDPARDIVAKGLTTVVARDPHVAVFHSLHQARSFVSRALYPFGRDVSQAAD